MREWIGKQMAKLVGDRVWDILVNRAHTVIGTVYAFALLLYVWKTGRDVGQGLLGASACFYGFLGGHAYLYQKYPDKGDGGQPQQ